MRHSLQTPLVASDEIPSLPYTLMQREECEYNDRKKYSNSSVGKLAREEDQVGLFVQQSRRWISGRERLQVSGESRCSAFQLMAKSEISSIKPGPGASTACYSRKLCSRTDVTRLSIVEAQNQANIKTKLIPR